MRKKRTTLVGMVIGALALAALACNAPTAPSAADEVSTSAAETAAAVAGIPSATVPVEGTADLTQAAQIPPTSDVPTNTAAPQQCQVTATTAVNIRTGPSTYHTILGILQKDVNAPVTGRNNDTSWWQINGNSWVSAPYVTTSGNCNNVPVAAYPPAPPTFTPTATATNTPTPTFTPTFTATFTATTETPDVDFEVSYVSSWTCSGIGRASFSITNTGGMKLQSLRYDLEGPIGNPLNGASTDTPFKASATSPDATCAQAGNESLNLGESAYLQLVVNPPAPAGTKGRLILKVCSENNKGGTCTEKTFDFTW